MDFEFIDEDQIEHSRHVKQKKTPSLFDSKLEDRTYWGRTEINDNLSVIDPGTQLSFSLMKSRIMSAIRNGHLIDIDDHEISIRLAMEFRNQLKDFQMEVLMEMMMNKPFEIVRDEYGNYLINAEVQ